MKEDEISCEPDYTTWIGCRIVKKSGKPFKSGLKMGIPISIETNSNSGHAAFIMKDDNTPVDCFRCKLLVDWEDDDFYRKETKIIAKDLWAQFGLNAKYVVSEILEATKKLKDSDKFEEVYKLYSDVKHELHLMQTKQAFS